MRVIVACKCDNAVKVAIVWQTVTLDPSPSVIAGTDMPKPAPVVDEVTVRGALGRLGVPHAGVGTLAIAAKTICDLSPDAIWRAWTDIESWPKWSRPLHVSSRWLEKRQWEVGAKFEQVRDLGFPFGRVLSIETVREVNEHQSVSWWKSEHGVSSCHIWFFEPLNNGGTAITNTEVFVGPAIALSRPMVRARWTRMFESSARGLVAFARTIRAESAR